MTEDEVVTDKGMKLQFYCSTLYNHMSENSLTLTETIEDKEITAVVWQGRIVQTCVELGIPEGSYKRVTDKLRTLGCIEWVERGYRGESLSSCILHYPPTPDRWEREISLEALTRAPNLDRLSADVQALREELRSKLGGLDVVEMGRNFEERISRLEGLLNKGDNAKR